MSTYKEAGVDIAAGEDTVRRIKPLARSTFTKGVLADIGAFGAFFEVDYKAYHEPVMVSSVDGVGTKLKIAFMMDRHDTVGQDLVNHCVNDIAVCGATPLFFLDYFATGKLDQDAAIDVITGFTKACVENKCALIGGETAEMPDLYSDGEYDLAGTIVGIVEKAKIIDGSKIREGDVLIGFPSTGLHTNGYSLARHVLFSEYSVGDRPEELHGSSIGDALLAIHRSYLSLIYGIKASVEVRGLVHVTGGGIEGNTKRIIPDGLRFEIDYSAWERPDIFRLIQDTGAVAEREMRRAFNLGIGLIAIIPPEESDSMMAIGNGECPIRIGSVIAK